MKQEKCSSRSRKNRELRRGRSTGSNAADCSGKIKTERSHGLWKMQEIWKFLVTLMKVVSVAWGLGQKPDFSKLKSEQSKREL